MALKTGKNLEEIKQLVAERKKLLEQGDITGKYSELMIDVTSDDLGSVNKNNDKAFDNILDKAKDKVVELDINELSESPKNHFSKISGEKREEMIGSLKSYGQINPIIVRPKECVQHYKELIENEFEILVGHTRVECLKEIGSSKVNAIIVSCDDIEATLLINQSNIQREKVSDIELARAYKATYDALVQDKNRNLSPGNSKNEIVENSTSLSKSHFETSKRTDEEVAKKYGISRATLMRKMALANCSDDIVRLYNRSKVTQEEIQHISKLPRAVQDQVSEIMTKENKEMTKDIAKGLVDKYKEVQKDPPLRASFPWNALREVINQGQDNIEKQEKKHRAVNKKAKDEKKKYHISEELFPKNLKLSDRQRYVELALKYIASQKIDVFDTSIENER